MPHDTGERVPCDCKLQHSNLVAVSTRRAHRRKYGVHESFIRHPSQLVDDSTLGPEPVDDAQMDENMLVDDILENLSQDWGDEDDDDDEIGIFPTFDEDGSSDEDAEEDDVDEDSLVDEEDVDEDLLMEDDISTGAGLVFAPNDLAEEISFLRSLSGYSDGMLLLTCSTRARSTYEKNNEIIRLEMRVKFERYEIW